MGLIKPTFLRSSDASLEHSIVYKDKHTGELVGPDYSDVESTGSPDFSSINIKYLKKKIKEIPSNMPRFQNGMFGKAIIMEGSSTNLVDNSSFASNDFTDWSTGGTATTSITSSTTLNGRYALDFTASGADRLLYQSVGLTVVPYTISAYVKDVNNNIVDSSVCQVYGSTVDENQSALTTYYEYLGDGWYRVYGFFDADTGICYYGVEIKSGKQVYIDAVQLEAKEFPTSYIFTTTGSSASRNADTLTYALSASTYSLTLADAGTVSVWIKPYFFRGITAGTYTVLHIGDGSDYYQLRYNVTGDQFEFYDTESAVSAYIDAVFDRNKFIYLTATWTGSTSNIYVNGVSGITNSSFDSIDAEPTLLTIGTDYAGSNPFYGLIDDLMVL